MTGPHPLLNRLFDAAMKAADPYDLVAPHLPPPPKGRTVVLGAGKAAARMAEAVEHHWQGPLAGLVVTRYGHGASTRQIEVIEAGHPVPDAAGEDAARRMLALAESLGPDDLVLCLVSGGGSALMSLPAPGISFEEKRALNEELLRCGAPIGEMNCVRRHLSSIKGGRLALACHPARVVTLVVSDVPGDDPAVVASGPTVPDGSSGEAALAILNKYGIAVSSAVRTLLADPQATPRADDPRLAHNETHVIVTAQQALDAAAEAARAAGYTPLILSSSMEGEARDVALVHASIARQVVAHGQPLKAPCVILSGGETSVTVRGRGRGGRNAEFLLALAVALNGLPGVHALAVDTDGIDGTEDNAGAWLAPGTLALARSKGLDARVRLLDNDGYGFFSALGQLVVTGPTRTNVNDLRAIVIEADVL